MAQQDPTSYPKITGKQCEKLGIRHLPLHINYATFKKTDKEKAELATAKAAHNYVMKNNPVGYRVAQDQLANEMLHAGAPRWGSFSLNGMKLGI